MQCLVRNLARELLEVETEPDGAAGRVAQLVHVLAGGGRVRLVAVGDERDGERHLQRQTVVGKIKILHT